MSSGSFLVCLKVFFCFFSSLSSLSPAPPSAGMKIVYMHDDTETLEDAVVLRLTDGVHTVEGTARVTVLPVNDNKPLLLKYTNTHAHVPVSVRSSTDTTHSLNLES